MLMNLKAQIKNEQKKQCACSNKSRLVPAKRQQKKSI